MRPNRDRSELYWIGRKLKLSVAMPKLLGGVEKKRPFFANGRILVCITGVLVDLRKLFKTPLQFRLARAFNCHTEQTAVPLLVKGYFWRAFLRRFLEPAVFCHDCNVASYCIGKCYGIKKIGNPDTFETIRFAKNKAPQRFQKRVLLSSVPDGVGQLPMLKLSVEKHPGFSHWFES